MNEMKITIEHYPKEYLEIIYTAGRNCYGTRDAAKIINLDTTNPKANWQKLEKFTSMLVNKGHESVLEHICISIYAKDVSRSFLAQITRHRLVSYSVKSQHYVKHNDFEYKELEDYGGQVENMIEYYGLMQRIDDFYKQLIDTGVPNYIAREVLPNACLTDIYMTANAREWRHIIRMRIGKENTPEIQSFSKILLRELYMLMPELFKDLRDEFMEAGE